MSLLYITKDEFVDSPGPVPGGGGGGGGNHVIQQYKTKFIYIVGDTNSITLAMNSYLPT